MATKENSNFFFFFSFFPLLGGLHRHAVLRRRIIPLASERACAYMRDASLIFISGHKSRLAVLLLLLLQMVGGGRRREVEEVAVGYWANAQGSALFAHWRDTARCSA